MARMRLETALREAKPAMVWTEVEQAVQSEPVGRAAQEPVWQRARLETEQPAQPEAEQAVQPQPGSKHAETAASEISTPHGGNAGASADAAPAAAVVQIPSDAVKYVVQEETLYGICMERYHSMAPDPTDLRMERTGG